MTLPARPWLLRFSDPKALSDLRAAAESCMRSICECVPAECEHADNRMTALEFAEWIEREVMLSGRTAHTSTTSRELARAAARRRFSRLESVTA